MDLRRLHEALPPTQHLNITLFNCMVCSILYLESNMGLHYRTVMGRYLELKEKLMLVRKMNSASMNSKSFVNFVGILNNSLAMTRIFGE